MSLCDFERFDPPPVQDLNLSEDFILWLGQLSDDLNQFLSDLEDCLPVKYIGKENNSGGAATITITVSGVKSTDIAHVQLEQSTNAVSVMTVNPGTDSIDVALSGDPGANTILTYVVYRED